MVINCYCEKFYHIQNGWIPPRRSWHNTEPPLADQKPTQADLESSISKLTNKLTQTSPSVGVTCHMGVVSKSFWDGIFSFYFYRKSISCLITLSMVECSRNANFLGKFLSFLKGVHTYDFIRCDCHRSVWNKPMIVYTERYTRMMRSGFSLVLSTV